MSKIFYGVYLDRQDASTALDLIRFLGEPGSVRFSHITLRGPYRAPMPKGRLEEINSNPKYEWIVDLSDPVVFFNDRQSTVAIAVDLRSMTDLLHKPDFPNGIPHITLYDGPDRLFAQELHAIISRLVWRNTLGVSQLKLIQPKKNIANEFMPFFTSFHALYEKIVGDPARIGETGSLPRDLRLDMIEEIVRGQRPQRVAPSPDKEVVVGKRSVWA